MGLIQIFEKHSLLYNLQLFCHDIVYAHPLINLKE
jgi:hypothetical protein